MGQDRGKNSGKKMSKVQLCLLFYPIFSRLISRERKNIKIYSGKVKGHDMTQFHKT